METSFKKWSWGPVLVRCAFNKGGTCKETYNMTDGTSARLVEEANVIVVNRFGCPATNCDKDYAQTENYRRHYKRAHVDEPVVYACVVADCTAKFSRKCNCIAHVHAQHDFPLPEADQRRFANMQERKPRGTYADVPEPIVVPIFRQLYESLVSAVEDGRINNGRDPRRVDRHNVLSEASVRLVDDFEEDPLIREQPTLSKHNTHISASTWPAQAAHVSAQLGPFPFDATGVRDSSLFGPVEQYQLTMIPSLGPNLQSDMTHSRPSTSFPAVDYAELAMQPLKIQADYAFGSSASQQGLSVESPMHLQTSGQIGYPATVVSPGRFQADLSLSPISSSLSGMGPTESRGTPATFPSAVYGSTIYGGTSSSIVNGHTSTRALDYEQYGAISSYMEFPQPMEPDRTYDESTFVFSAVSQQYPDQPEIEDWFSTSMNSQMAPAVNDPRSGGRDSLHTLGFYPDHVPSAFPGIPRMEDLHGWDLSALQRA